MPQYVCTAAVLRFVTCQYIIMFNGHNLRIEKTYVSWF